MSICVICSTPFIPTRHSTGKYCSRRCGWLARGGAEYNARIARESAKKRGDKLRHTGVLSHTYVKRDARHEHWSVAETTLGRPLTRREVVHHIDGNPKNNDPSNLMVITQGQHMREHGLGLPGVTPAHRPGDHRRKGQDDPAAKVCDADVIRIREMALYGAKQRDIGAIFDMGQPHISAIVHRKRWSHV